MKTIYKYTLGVTDMNAIPMPFGAEILSVQVQNGSPQIWALVEKNAVPFTRYFATVGTGNPFETEYKDEFGDQVKPKFIGTYQLEGGKLVFHVFEVPEP